MVGNFQFTAVYTGEGFTINKAVAKYGDSCSVPTYTDKPGALIFITNGRMKLLDREGVLFTEMLSPNLVPEPMEKCAVWAESPNSTTRSSSTQFRHSSCGKLIHAEPCTWAELVIRS